MFLPTRYFYKPPIYHLVTICRKPRQKMITSKFISNWAGCFSPYMLFVKFFAYLNCYNFFRNYATVNFYPFSCCINLVLLWETLSQAGKRCNSSSKSMSQTGQLGEKHAFYSHICPFSVTSLSFFINLCPFSRFDATNMQQKLQ